ncbi:flagellar basal-body rod modification protein FlgD [Mariprofundus ferrinatatus]|uniref:Basal-body rod modification protein FlgD n=1 Tax=Mariprofundus ferrinatatus TaxID=1921087 RepID=A0A2K8L6F4_9PROT|nr:flagellar hook capping FlgD N-terminal domain-containing protein [Mariprofundus ferrinatatus]ATX82898.1 flagellar basal-body rod modification protein FlgD [Mariprofundus ferrinatatus]
MQVSAAQNSQVTAAGSSSRNDLGQKDIFLKILVAQMQNQDPLKPQDAAQQSTQLAQFNMVEQQISTNKLLESMLANSQSGNSEMATASSYLGHKVLADSSAFTFDGSTPVQFSADLQSGAAAADVQIVDSVGRTVRTMHSSALPAGINNLTWDGKTDAGSTARPDNYIVKIAATDSTGQPVPANTSIRGQVTAVRLTPEGVNIMVGDTPVSMASIREIQ